MHAPADTPDPQRPRRRLVLAAPFVSIVIVAIALSVVLSRTGQPSARRSGTPAPPGPSTAPAPDAKAALRRALRLEWTTPAQWLEVSAPGLGEVARYRIAGDPAVGVRDAEVVFTWSPAGQGPRVEEMVEAWSRQVHDERGQVVPLTAERLRAGYLEATLVSGAGASIEGFGGQPLDLGDAYTLFGATIRGGPGGELHLRAVGPTPVLGPRLDEVREMIRTMRVAPPEGSADGPG
jgi:hypothetical protein